MERKQFTCNSFIFYGSFYEAISELPMENQGRIYDAIFKFAFEDIEVELNGVDRAVFTLIKPQLIANRAKYENGCKGGRPKKTTEIEAKENLTETEIKPKHNLSKTKAKPNENDNDNVNENNSQLKILKEKLFNQGAYAGKIHNALIDEVAEALAKACDLERPLTFNKKSYGAEDFRRIADGITVDQVCRVVNSLLSYKDGIENREIYILGILAERSK